ncbi:MAG: cob(I)yrinic acid a,c-diamide adenosyltransferase [Clostridiales Family XIII bacterium]|nr:cob(I)yrinic acid a,c-diamide adenosyltransferase [Clostridiales Family XIII bacterium]
MIHLYVGDGKGKTTAAVGLAVRAAGSGKRVVFVQFLKGSETGEVSSLAALGIPVIRMKQNLGFVWTMDDAEKEQCRAAQARLLEEARAAAPFESDATGSASPAGVIVLDEALDAVGVGMLEEDALRAFAEKQPAGTELVVTGRIAPGWLMEKADYITEMLKVKHPYDRGVMARTGIEF